MRCNGCGQIDHAGGCDLVEFYFYQRFGKAADRTPSPPTPLIEGLAPRSNEAPPLSPQTDKWQNVPSFVQSAAQSHEDRRESTEICGTFHATGVNSGIAENTGKSDGKDDLQQVRGTERPASAEVLSEVSRGEHAQNQTEAQRLAANSEKEGNLSGDVSDLSGAWENNAETVSGMRGNGAKASRGLHEASAGNVAMSSVPSTASQTRKTSRKSGKRRDTLKTTGKAKPVDSPEMVKHRAAIKLARQKRMEYARSCRKAAA